MKLIFAKTAGFCFGVRRAVDLCEKAAEQPGNCFTLGPIIHNKSVTGMLAEKGVIEVHDLSQITAADTVVIRSHGIGRNDYDILAERCVSFVDATCPDVAKIHRIVESEADSGRQIVIIGEQSHPEVIAISGWCHEPLVFDTPDKLQAWITDSKQNCEIPISVVFQTTGTKKAYELCLEIIKKECTNYKIFDTMCNATLKRQMEAAEIAGNVDAMIVIGGKNSANSLRLAEICAEHCDRVYFIESADELDLSVFNTSDTVGVTAGASTPAWIIKEVNQKMSDEIKIEEMPEDTLLQAEPAGEADVTESNTSEAVADPSEEVAESFEEMLEKSIKTLHTGEKVKGIIGAISPTEISVDLGTKQSGYIPFSELTDDPTAKIEDLVKVGDEIETYVMRVNDVEGTVMLSKKRLDSSKSWDDIDAAKDSKAIVEGFVVEENKGGIVVSVKGVRVFVPASQTGLAKDIPLTTMLKTKVKLRITEVNQSRRRVVGSIRAVAYDERRAQAEQIWNDIAVGKKYNGTVKSMTSYGAFIDIGGIDGMIHVSELSWTRIHQPSDVVSIGDELEVYVISFDPEKKKISLGYKDNTENPWSKFNASYKVDDTIDVKVVKLMPFGAFAEIMPGVDGLIHISQITDHRIGQPAEVLSEGQTVTVKITDIDQEKQKVSLSIRALISHPSATTQNELSESDTGADDELLSAKDESDN